MVLVSPYYRSYYTHDKQFVSSFLIMHVFHNPSYFQESEPYTPTSAKPNLWLIHT